MRCPPAAKLEASQDVDLLAAARQRPPLAGAYCSYPAVSGEQLAFVTEGEVWLASLGGGGGAVCVPRRVTDSGAEASRLRFSPDGSLLAYSLYEDGYQEVYCCASGGGRSKRLTYLGDSCWVAGWSRDGRSVIFASTAGCADSAVDGRRTLWQVSVAGGAPISLGLGPAQSIALQPNGGPGVLLGRDTGDPAVDEWKGYQGGRGGQLWLDATGGGTFTQLDPLPGRDDGNCHQLGQIGVPLWLGDRIFFVADHSGDAGAGGDLFSCTSREDLRPHGCIQSHPGFCENKS